MELLKPLKLECPVEVKPDAVTLPEERVNLASTTPVVTSTSETPAEEKGQVLETDDSSAEESESDSTVSTDALFTKWNGFVCIRRDDVTRLPTRATTSFLKPITVSKWLFDTHECTVNHSVYTTSLGSVSYTTESYEVKRVERCSMFPPKSKASYTITYKDKDYYVTPSSSAVLLKTFKKQVKNV